MIMQRKEDDLKKLKMTKAEVIKKIKDIFYTKNLGLGYIINWYLVICVKLFIGI